MKSGTASGGEKKIEKLFRALKDLCFPPYCLCCNCPLPDSQLLICKGCLSGFRFSRTPLCVRCGIVFDAEEGENHLCSHCIKRRPYYVRARSLFVYEKQVAGLVAGLKYNGKTALLATLKTLLAQNSSIVEPGWPDYILPVPLHPKKLRKRGYNQAILLARSLFPEEREKVRTDVLIKIRDTPSQTGLSGAERRKNLRNAFLVTNPGAVAGKKILLVDDVYTTGTTVNECARVLAEAGARSIEVFTLARVKE